jgi:hypothetical protein
MSGYPPDERFHMQQLIIENGGINCDKMSKQCSHLIALTSSSEKYIAAKEWKTIHVVNKKWLFDCIEQQTWLLEVPYMVLPEHTKPPNIRETDRLREIALKRM